MDRLKLAIGPGTGPGAGPPRGPTLRPGKTQTATKCLEALSFIYEMRPGNVRAVINSSNINTLPVEDVSLVDYRSVFIHLS